MATKKLEQSLRQSAASKAWLSVVHAYNLCDTAIAARLAPLGLRVGEHEVLANLLLAPGITQQALAQRCFVAKSGISMLLTRMEAQDLLRREADAKDGRIKRLSLTKTGTALAEQTLAIQNEIIGHMTAPLSDQELSGLTELSERVVAQLEALLDP
ncbi:MAG: MarR family transcriptional regulator [Rhodocyclaceae bacterium]|jgi:DNA-binding MarR family transcriptional regulator|nr:MarR family transcriptional regulator [Rhodocyclaceae bacterium]MBK6908894.1 MarR family transcriptional regulator [Rhodocyclaceae bacterium]